MAKTAMAGVRLDGCGMPHKQLGREEALLSLDQAGCAAMTGQEKKQVA